ncbi:hybrid sensor histidine kinase/response regulator [Desulfococcaceae bacterium HSG9]|nr:hybrid sensor histidine kinase/response regulator [Desulfococcaceae bacterium HSG9]
MNPENSTIDDLISSDREIMESFISEAKEHLHTIEDDFLLLEQQADNPEKELLNKVFRAIHSVKGAAGFLGLENMTRLSHVMEALLTMMREGEILPESEFIDALLGGTDILTIMLDDVNHSDNIDITKVYDRLTTLLGRQLAPKSADSPSSSSSPPSNEQPEPVTVFEPSQATEDAFEIQQIDDQPTSQAKKQKNEKANSVPETANTEKLLGNTVRIHVNLLDELMTMAGELVLARNQLMRTIEKMDPHVRTVAQRLDAITSELQETIILTRMQPIGKIFGKFPRIIRNISKRLGKKIHLIINGSKAEVDKTILESLADPMTHIIRNCCDHGIEQPYDRINAGKPESGEIVLSAFHEAGRVNIEVRDDGRGIDIEMIRLKALQKGLKTEAELNRMDKHEIIRLILIPGFTTVDAISDVSGRGVGMDVVKTGIEKLGGSLDIKSVRGKGTSIQLRMPLTLAIIPSLIVSSGDAKYALPQANIVEMVCLYDEDIKNCIECADDQEVFRLRDRLLPIVRLDEVLAHPNPFTRDVRAGITEKYRQKYEEINFEDTYNEDNYDEITQSLSFAVLNTSAGRFGLIIDHITGAEEIVVKPMHSAVKSLPIYSGATIMGDGNVALILDVEGIARHAGVIRNGRIDTVIPLPESSQEKKNLQTVLLFKSGPHEHFAIALPLIRRVVPIKIADIEQIGKRRYITIDDLSTLVLSMDQVLNVSSAVDQEDMYLILPRHIKRPVGLLISELVDITETAIQLNVQSYIEDGLLGTDIINNNMTLFIDIYHIVEIAEPEWFAERRIGLFGTPEPPPESTRQVLLLEDASFFRHLIKGYLEADGYQVTAVENGQLGLKCLEKNEFDLIVSDLEMPVMNGWEFMRNVRRGIRQPKIPAIALTSLDTEKDRVQTMECGYDCYEVKMDREQFLTSVAHILKKT